MIFCDVYYWLSFLQCLMVCEFCYASLENNRGSVTSFVFCVPPMCASSPRQAPPSHHKANEVRKKASYFHKMFVCISYIRGFG